MTYEKNETVIAPHNSEETSSIARSIAAYAATEAAIESAAGEAGVSSLSPESANRAVAFGVIASLIVCTVACVGSLYYSGVLSLLQQYIR